jgi:hypothetical protein
MRGLNAFISDIRGCQNKESEANRVEKELASIRTTLLFKLDLKPKKGFRVMIARNMLGNYSIYIFLDTMLILAYKNLFILLILTAFQKSTLDTLQLVSIDF